MNAHVTPPTLAPGFHGSYAPSDVTFLLKPVSLEPTDVAEKERLIQGGLRHYSEMVSRETAPGPDYAAIYASALDAGVSRLGREIAALARALFRGPRVPVTLASLVRAGVPLGVLLHRTLRHLGADSAHFGVSIIRDRGIDDRALDHILARRPADSVVFVDGWTGKGAITGELERSLAPRPELAPRLVVLADPAGRAWLSASGEDWLIPSGILGCTVSGLLSRSILNDAVVGAGDFHGCTVQSHLSDHDQSRAFVDRVWPSVAANLETASAATWTDADRHRHRTAAEAVVDALAERFGVTNRNRIKPGIAEATRAVLRRMPERVLVSRLDDPDLAALLELASRSGVPVEPLGDAILPYRAVTLIQKI
jgi:hypothetical protein